MKLPKTKAQIRSELNQQVDAYLAGGGDIQDVPRGLSGNNDNSNPFSQGVDSAPKQERTLLTHVVQEMEQRKQQGVASDSSAQAGGKRKKVLITDDFGEPVRWVWVEENS